MVEYLEYLNIIISIFTLLTLFWGLYYAIYRFGLKRERFTFLRLAINANPICKSHNLTLIVITVHLDNVGDTRINARQTRRTDGYLYNDGFDNCLHAGTLKIRGVPEEEDPLLFDWYSLSPLRLVTRLVPADKLMISEEDMENINYLNEDQDPATNYKEVDFWLEPHESYDLIVPVWLRHGVYAAKAFFVGSLTKHGEEEYWSCLTVFNV